MSNHTLPSLRFGFRLDFKLKMIHIKGGDFTLIINACQTNI